jgi:hypothetical protein
MLSRPLPTDTTPDRSASADSPENTVLRTAPKTPDPVEPHWDLVIAAATD